MNNRSFRIIKQNRGQSLIQTLLGMGIMSIIASSMISLISDQNKHARGLAEKLSKLDLENHLSDILTDPATCSALLTAGGSTYNFNTLSGLKIDYSEIKASAATTAPTVVKVGNSINFNGGNSLKVSRISLGNIVNSGVADKYVAKLNIGFDPKSTTRPLRDISLNVVLYTDPASPLATKKIMGCNPTAGAGSCYSFDPYTYAGWKYDGIQKVGCPQGEYMSSFDSYHWKNGLQRITKITCCALPNSSPTTWTSSSDYNEYK